MSDINILLLGDLYSDQLPPNDWLSPNIRELFKSYHLVSCNLEGPATKSNKQSVKVGPHLKQSPSVIRHFINDGISIFNLANNHLMDYGAQGMQSTIKKISAHKAQYVGASLTHQNLYSPLEVTLSDIPVSIISGCEHEFGITPESEQQSGVAWINDPAIDREIIKARAKGHFIIVQPHGGEEAGIPLPEWRSRYHHFVNLGANVVIGHHSHAPQGWEKYQGMMIYYSLGNFYFYNQSLESSLRGYMVSLKIRENLSYTSKVIPVIRNNQQVGINNSALDQLRIDSRNIISPQYLSLANQQALDLWDKYYSRYFASSISNNPLSRFFGSRFNYPMILHNLRIESHRWTINRAISQLIEKEGEK